MARLTKRRLEAMDAAVGAMLAGMQGEGDWPAEVTRDDLEGADTWISDQLAKRERAALNPKGAA